MSESLPDETGLEAGGAAPDPSEPPGQYTKSKHTTKFRVQGTSTMHRHLHFRDAAPTDDLMMLNTNRITPADQSNPIAKLNTRRMGQ